METITAQQMRDLERTAIESGAVTGLELMERAGRGVVEAVVEEWPELAEGPHRAVVLCGPGNNGGDGFVVARLLGELCWEVDVYFLGDPEKLPPDASENHRLWRVLGPIGDVGSLREEMAFPAFDADNPSVSLFVDACFGIGLKRPIAPPISDIAFSLNDRKEPRRGWIVSVDVPSGLDSETGAALGGNDNAFFADLTVTFHRPKPGHFLNDGPDHCGKVVVKDIGL